MNQFNRMLALLDGSVYSASVCHHAAWVAQRCHSGIDLMHVIGRRGVSSQASNLSGNIGLGARTALLAELSEHDEQKAKLAQSRGRAILEDATELLNQAGVTDVSARMRNGEIVETVQTCESKADLIVMGKRGAGHEYDRLHPGSNLERVIRSCSSPVLVAAREFRDISRILVAFDGGDSARKAVQHLIENNLYEGLSVKLLMATEGGSEQQRSLQEATASLSAAGFDVSSEVKTGQPEVVISAAVEQENFNLLVMGAYGHSRIRSLIIGSTTTAMMVSCKIPLMLIR